MIPGILGATGRFLNIAALPNCALWLDPSDASTITQSSGLVSQINDKSGNSRHFTQATGTLQPRIDTRTQNGLAVLDFNGDRMVLGSNGLGRNVGAVTIYLVARIESQYSTAGNDGVLFNIADSSGGRGRATIGVGQFGDFKPYIFGDPQDNAWGPVLKSSSSFLPRFRIYTAVFDYANGDAFLYVDGTLEASSTTYNTPSNTANTDSASASLAAFADSGSNMPKCQITELAVFHAAHSADQRALVHEYLNRKWGLPDVGGVITWASPVAVGTGTTSLDTPSGQVVEYGWRFSSVSGTVAGIVFANAIAQIATYGGTATSGLLVTNSDATFQGLLNSCVWINGMLEVTLNGLQKYSRYAVQLFYSDMRSPWGERNQRFEDPQGNTSSSFRNDSHQYVIGEFVANGPTQKLFIRWTSGSSQSASLSLLVLRRFT